MKIAKIHHKGLCPKCEKQIEWKRKYRKYKPIKRPGVCVECGKRNVMRAYHILCDSCACGKRCPKCRTEHDITNEVDDERRAEKLEDMLSKGSQSVSKKNSVRRALERGDLEIVEDD